MGALEKGACMGMGNPGLDCCLSCVEVFKEKQRQNGNSDRATSQLEGKEQRLVSYSVLLELLLVFSLLIKRKKINTKILIKPMKWTMMEWEIMEDFHKKTSLFFSCSYKTFYKIDYCY